MRYNVSICLRKLRRLLTISVSMAVSETPNESVTLPTGSAGVGDFDAAVMEKQT